MQSTFDLFDELNRSANNYFEEEEEEEAEYAINGQALVVQEHPLSEKSWPLVSNEIPGIEVPRVILQNVIASVNLCTYMDLRRIAVSARNAEYNPTKVNAVIIRMRNPKCTGLIFRSGKMMLTGAKSLEDIRIGGKKIAKLCLKIGHANVRFRGFKIENLIASSVVFLFD